LILSVAHATVDQRNERGLNTGCTAHPWPWRRQRSINPLAGARARQRSAALILGAGLTPGRGDGSAVLTRWQGPRATTERGLDTGCRGHPWPWRRQRSINPSAGARARQRSAAL